MPADLIILAAVAAFVLLRLRSVLGHKIGHDEPPKVKDVTPQAAERIVQIAPKPQDNDKLPEVIIEPLSDTDEKWSEAVIDGINTVRAKDSQFSMKHFLEGAKTAFEMTLSAFNKNDQETLKSLLSKDIFQHFKQEMETLSKQDEHVETTLVSMISAEPAEVAVDGGKARITVTFQSEQIQSSRDKSGKTVPGSTSDIQTVEDVWTFEKNLNSSNPNWTIITT